jgi:hypothetical protein
MCLSSACDQQCTSVSARESSILITITCDVLSQAIKGEQLRTGMCNSLPWHGRGRRFDPDQVHHPFNHLQRSSFQLGVIWRQMHNFFKPILKTHLGIRAELVGGPALFI